MNEFHENKTYFLDEQFDFESIMQEFGSGGSSDDIDYDAIGTVHFGLEDDDELYSSLLSSDDLLYAAEPEPSRPAEAPVADDSCAPEPDAEAGSAAESEDDADMYADAYLSYEAESEVSFCTVDESEREAEAAVRNDAPRAARVKPKPKSFAEAVSAPVIAALAFLALKLRQSRITLGEFMAEDDEELGDELSPDKAAKFYAGHMRGLRLRTRLSFVLTLVLVWLSYGLPVSGSLRDVGVKAAVCTVLLLTVMLCGLDIVTDGLLAFKRKKLNANTLIALSSVLCAADGLIIAAGGKSAGLPFSVIPALTVSFSLLGSYMNCRSLRAVFGTVDSTRKPYIVSSDTSADGSGVTLRKAPGVTQGFVRRAEQAGPDETAYSVMSPFLILISLFLSIIAAAVSGSFSSYMHILSGVFVFSAPAAMLLSYPLPNLISSVALRAKGSAIAGWSGIYDIGVCRRIVVTDSDIFPDDKVKISNVRIFSGTKPERALSLACSIISASGSSLSPAFSELMLSGKGSLLRVDNFECHDGGGLTAMVDGSQVFCGSASFMHLMGIHLPEKYSFRDCIYVSEGKTICAMFMMEYTPSSAVKAALETLLGSQYRPIFAIRDFNITPRLISVKYDIATDGFDFPPFAERYRISEPLSSEGSLPAAMVSREGLDSFVTLAEHAKSLYRRIRICVLLSILTTVIGIAFMFILGLSGAMSVSSALSFSLVCLLPVLIISLTLNTDI